MEDVRLEDVLYSEITDLSTAGDLLAEAGDYENALVKFRMALNLVPVPGTKWAVSLWLYASIGDIYFLTRNYTAAIDNFLKALHAPDGHKNAFVLLRLGELYYETHIRDKARKYLLHAYVLKGSEIFEAEHEKYFSFLQKNVFL